ncbi:MAG: LCP family protein [Oscillospiraceae bacterium]|nr:LCP family protein [Oscillospiraceae bacterium]
MRRKRANILTVVILAAVLAVFVAVFIKLNPGLLYKSNSGVPGTVNDSTDDYVEESVDSVVDSPTYDIIEDEDSEYEAEAISETYDSQDETSSESERLTGVLNILFLGTDERSDDYSENARSDSMMVLSLDFDNCTAKLVSFERGMGVPILSELYEGEYDWLTHCFRYGGASLVLKELQECFSLDVNYYFRANFDSFAEIIELVGGVDIDLTEAEAEYINAALNLEGEDALQEGMNHLNGEEALSYSRCRQIDSDWHRIERQRNVIQACTDNISALDSDERFEVCLKIFSLLLTNMDSELLLQMETQLSDFVGVQMDQMTIPAEGTYTSMIGMGGRSMFAPDFEENSRILHEFLYGDEE